MLVDGHGNPVLLLVTRRRHKAIGRAYGGRRMFAISMEILLRDITHNGLPDNYGWSKENPFMRPLQGSRICQNCAAATGGGEWHLNIPPATGRNHWSGGSAVMRT